MNIIHAGGEVDNKHYSNSFESIIHNININKNINIIIEIDVIKINDAFVIALTALNSPLAEQSNLVLSLGVPEDTDIYMPMSSRIAQLVLIDVLTTGFTLRRGAKFRDNLKRVKAGIKDSRFEKNN